MRHIILARLAVPVRRGIRVLLLTHALRRPVQRPHVRRRLPIRVPQPIPVRPIIHVARGTRVRRIDAKTALWF